VDRLIEMNQGCIRANTRSSTPCMAILTLSRRQSSARIIVSRPGPLGMVSSPGVLRNTVSSVASFCWVTSSRTASADRITGVRLRIAARIRLSPVCWVPITWIRRLPLVATQ